MTTMPEPPRRQAAYLLRWCLTSQDGAYINCAGISVLGSRSTPIDPAKHFQYRSLQPNILLNRRSGSTFAQATAPSAALKSP